MSASRSIFMFWWSLAFLIPSASATRSAWALCMATVFLRMEAVLLAISCNESVWVSAAFPP